MGSLAETLRNRGLVYQHSGEKLEEITESGPHTLYLGFDPSADSLHVGNLVPYMIVRRFVAEGHKAILLVGGGTGMIGDPSGKSTERALLDDAIVSENAAKIAAQVKTILGVGDIEVVNNADWLNGLSVIDFLRDTGKHFTVNAMIQKEMVKRRIEDPEQSISYTEFSYPLLQAYDYYHLNQTKGCTLQIGGSDQWGNITAGIDFIRRKTGQYVYGITAPLIVDRATGKKFGKSEGNAVWIDREKTTPYAFYQFWINQNDESVIDYLNVFTDVSGDEIAALAESLKSNPGAREAQKRLAFEATKLVHGEKEAQEAAQTAADIFSGNGDLAIAIKAGAPNIPIRLDELTAGKPLLQILVESGLASSNRDARTLIEAGGVSIDGEKVTATDTVISQAHFASRNQILLKKGKRDMVVLHVEG